jgi:hypothetical protein
MVGWHVVCGLSENITLLKQTFLKGLKYVCIAHHSWSF